MSTVRINVVYVNNIMRAPEIGPIRVESADAEVTWSKREKAGCDVVLYFNAYAWNARRARRNPDSYRICYLYEPAAVAPTQYRRSAWRRFDAILTWNTRLAESGGRFHRFPVVCYDFPFSAGFGVRYDGEDAELGRRRRAVCQICGDRYSLMPCELYSNRRSVAEWFHRQGSVPFDTYGLPGMKVPNYRGPVDDKKTVLRRYRYALCFENTYHPVWSSGYITEKLYDCLSALTLPVYYGASDIERHVPKECYVDFREFPRLEALDEFLGSMTDEEYLSRIESIRRFISEHNAAQRYSMYRLYERAAELYRSAGEASGAKEQGGGTGFPEDYWETASSASERARYLLTALALKHYRFVSPAFAAFRGLRLLARRREREEKTDD